MPCSETVSLSSTPSKEGELVKIPKMATHNAPLPNTQRVVGTPALPISVTTSSHADPSGIRSNSKPLQQTVINIPQPTRVSHPHVHSQVSIVTQHPAIQIICAAKSVPVIKSSGLTVSGGGITLPSQPLVPLVGSSPITLSAPTQHHQLHQKTPQLASIRILQPVRNFGQAHHHHQQQQQQPHGKISLGNRSVVYSAAGRASVLAQAQEATSNVYQPQQTVSHLGRRVNSAPTDLSNQANTHVSSSTSTFKYRKVIGGKSAVQRSTSMTLKREIDPQIFLDNILSSRGYCTRNFCSLEGGYYCKPTPLQKASYGIRIVRAVRASDSDSLVKLLNCGLSPNPCNAFGESVVHMVCRRGDYKLLKVLVDNGCSLQVTDDFGRTPLHDACWTAKPNFKIVELILNTDLRLLHLVDCRGSSPLSYVKRDHWDQWIEFFKSKVEIYWSPRDTKKMGEEPPPPLANEAPHSRPIPDPSNAISIEEAEKISAGKLDPEQILCKEKPVNLNNENVNGKSA